MNISKNIDYYGIVLDQITYIYYAFQHTVPSKHLLYVQSMKGWGSTNTTASETFSGG